MPQLTTAIDHLRRHLRRRIAVRALAWTAATLLGGVAMAGLLDAWVHVESSALRGLLLLGSIAAAMSVLTTQLVRPLRRAWDDVTIALLIERIHPELRDRLATAAGMRPESGAAAVNSRPENGADAGLLLTRLLTDADAATPPVLELQRTGRGMSIAGLGVLASVLAGLGVWFAVSPAQMLLALERQVRPFRAPDWPRSTVLLLLDEQLEPLSIDVHRCAADEPLTLYISNRRGRLPGDLRLERRQAGGDLQSVEWTPTSLRDRNGREQPFAVATMSPREGPLQIRAVGGDDDTMPWQSFEALPAPRIEQFRIHVRPPAYTGLPEVREQRAAAHVEAVLGTLVTLVARANVPLSEVTLHRDGQAPLPLALNADQLEFPAELTIESEGRSSFWFEIRDTYGLSVVRPPKYELRGRRDQPPVVQWQWPTTEMTVTSNARLPLEVECSDDFGLGNVFLNLSVNGDAGRNRQVPLLLHSKSEDTTAPFRLASLAHLWELEPLTFEPGDRVEYSIVAEDLRTPDPQQTSARPQSLTVVTPDQKRREIAGHQGGMFQLLSRSEGHHQSARAQWRELQAQWTVAQSLREADRELIRDLDRLQMRLLADLTDRRVGLAAQIQQVRDELKWNQLVDPPTSARMVRLTSHLESLVDEQLPQLTRHLSTLQQMVNPSGHDAAGSPRDEGMLHPGEADGFSAALDSVGEAHGGIHLILTAMLQELAEWRQRSDTGRVLDELLAAQQQIQAATGELADKTSTRALDSLSPQQRADLARLAERQRSLGSAAERAGRDSAEESPSPELDGNTRQLPVEIINGSLAGRMQQAADFLAVNQINQSQDQQQLIVEMLVGALDQLSSAGRNDPDSQLEALSKASAEVEEFRRRQTELRNRHDDLRPLSADAAEQDELQVLRKEHENLTDDLESLAVRLRRRLFSTPAATAAHAAQRSREAADALGPARTERVDAAQQAVLDDLTQLDRQLATEAERIEQRRQVQIMLTLVDALPPIQMAVLELAAETEAIEAIRTETQRLGRAELKRVQAVAIGLSPLAADLNSLRDQATSFELISRILDDAANAIRTASDRLADRLTDLETSTSLRSAAARIAVLIATLEHSADVAAENSASTGNPANNPDSAAVNWIELSLLRALQADLIARTEAWEQRLQGREPTAEEQSERDRLALEQIELGGRAHSLLERLQSRAGSPIESNPATSGGK